MIREIRKCLILKIEEGNDLGNDCYFNLKMFFKVLKVCCLK